MHAYSPCAAADVRYTHSRRAARSRRTESGARSRRTGSAKCHRPPACDNSAGLAQPYASQAAGGIENGASAACCDTNESRHHIVGVTLRLEASDYARLEPGCNGYRPSEGSGHGHREEESCQNLAHLRGSQGRTQGQTRVRGRRRGRMRHRRIDMRAPRSHRAGSAAQRHCHTRSALSSAGSAQVQVRVRDPRMHALAITLSV